MTNKIHPITRLARANREAQARQHAISRELAIALQKERASGATIKELTELMEATSRNTVNPYLRRRVEG